MWVSLFLYAPLWGLLVQYINDHHPIATGTKLCYNLCTFDGTAKVSQDMYDIHSIHLLLILWLHPFHCNFFPLWTTLQTTCIRMYEYDHYCIDYCLLVPALADKLVPIHAECDKVVKLLSSARYSPRFNWTNVCTSVCSIIFKTGLT